MTDRIPKLSFEQLPVRVAGLLKAKYDRLGYLGEFFARSAHQPEALEAFILFTEASKGALEMKTVELVALTVATMKQVAYEKNQHERLCIRLGFGRDWVDDLEKLNPDQAGTFSNEEKLVQRYVIDAVEHDGQNVTAQLDAVIDIFGYENAVAIMMVMARYLSHAVMVNSMSIASPVPSIFEDGFTGK